MKPLQLIKPDDSLEDATETGISGYSRGGSILQEALNEAGVPSPQQPGTEDEPPISGVGGKAFKPFPVGVPPPPPRLLDVPGESVAMFAKARLAIA